MKKLLIVLAMLSVILKADDRSWIQYDFGMNLNHESSDIRGKVSIQPQLVNNIKKTIHVPFYAVQGNITKVDESVRKDAIHKVGYVYGINNTHNFKVQGVDNSILGETSFDFTYEYMKQFKVVTDTSNRALRKFQFINAGIESGGTINRDEYKAYRPLGLVSLNLAYIVYTVDYTKKDTNQQTLVAFSFCNRSNAYNVPWEYKVNLRVEPYSHIFVEGTANWNKKYNVIAGVTGSL